MKLGSMHARFLVGASAWLLGAAAATGGSLLAVSLLGQGLAPAPGQQLTVAAVNRALASEAAEAARSPAATAPPSPSPSPSDSATPEERHHRGRRSAPATPPAVNPATQPAPTVLTSAGGTVLAGCEASGAYLVSWSPQQGYEAHQVVRGPAAKAKVTFTNSHRSVAMVVSCAGSVPSATTSIHNWGDE